MTELINNYIEYNNFKKKFIIKGREDYCYLTIYKAVNDDYTIKCKGVYGVYKNDCYIAKILNVDIKTYITLALQYTIDIKNTRSQDFFCIFFKSTKDIELFIKDLYKEVIQCQN